MLSVSCSKKSGSGTPVVTTIRLNHQCVVSTDSSVRFLLPLHNAVKYDYDLETILHKMMLVEIITYKYPFSGTYTVTVTAKRRGGQTISKKH